MTETTGSHRVTDADPTLGGLVNQLTTEVPELIRSEIRLAQAEMTEKGKRAGVGIGMFSGAGLLGFFGLGTLLATVILALALVMDAWLAALIVTVVLFIGAAVLALVGKNKVQEATPAVPGARRRRGQGRPRHPEGTPRMSTPEEIQADIERQREQLAETVDQLTQKLDVKAQAKAKVVDIQDRATTDDGKPRPEVLGAAAAAVALVGLLIWWRRR